MRSASFKQRLKNMIDYIDVFDINISFNEFSNTWYIMTAKLHCLKAFKSTYKWRNLLKWIKNWNSLKALWRFLNDCFSSWIKSWRRILMISRFLKNFLMLNNCLIKMIFLFCNELTRWTYLRINDLKYSIRSRKWLIFFKLFEKRNAIMTAIFFTEMNIFNKSIFWFNKMIDEYFK